MEPRGRILICDIKSIDILDSGFAVHLCDRTLTLTAGSPQEFEAWQAAWAEALEALEQAHSDGKPALGEDVGGASSDPRLVHQGPLSQRSGAVFRPMYFVLYTDRLDFFAGAGKPSSGAVPEGRLLVDDVEAVDVLGSGFLILGPSQRLDVQAADKPTFNAWMH